MKDLNQFKKWALFAALAILSLQACKKDKQADPQPTPQGPTVPGEVIPPTTNRSEMTRDSIYLYAKYIYLWRESLPLYKDFNPRANYGADLTGYNSELYALSQYAINPSTSKPYESSPLAPGRPKYSFIDDITTNNPVAVIKDQKASVDEEGNGNDVGFKPVFYATNTGPQSYESYIKLVYQNSPADKANLGRGDKITKINGVAIGADFNAEVGFLNTALNASPITLEGVRKDGSTYNVTLSKTVFKSSPVYKTTVVTSGTKKIGYLAYARFSNLSNSQPDLDAAFANFVAQGVTDLVIDLRYNGGGYVQSAEYLSNLIAPSSLSGTVMFKEYFNSVMQGGQATILSNQPYYSGDGSRPQINGHAATYADLDYSIAGNTTMFAKKGRLEGIGNVVFIVTGGTASASELVINNLKPKMSVKLVGQQTYGKPVGFFPVRIENRYDVYYSMFQSKNSADQGDYFGGMTVDNAGIATDFDDAKHDFGDPAESYMARAISYINPSAASPKSVAMMSIQGRNVSTSAVQVKHLQDNEFRGMIENRLRLKKK